MNDAWKQLDELLETNTQEWEVRQDLKVEALGCHRCVQLSVRYHKGDNPMSLANEKWATTQRNVSTMRELANAILAACDFVDKVNPEWASHHPGGLIFIAPGKGYWCNAHQTIHPPNHRCTEPPL